MDRSLCALNLAANDFDFHTAACVNFRDLAHFYVTITRRHHLMRCRKISPKLKSSHITCFIALGHFLVDDAAPGSHPLNISGTDHTFIPHAVSVFDISSQHISDCFNPPVWMPGEAFKIMAGIAGSTIVHETTPLQ